MVLAKQMASLALRPQRSPDARARANLKES